MSRTSDQRLAAHRRAFSGDGLDRDPLDRVHQRVVSVFLHFAIIADAFAVRPISGDIQVPAADRQKLLELLDKTAADHGVSRTVISLAWLMKHPSKIIPIVGSNNPQHLNEAVKADTLDLSREEWYRILVVARGEPLP